MRPLPRLAKLILGAPADHIDPVLDKEPQEVLDRQRLGPAVDQGQHDHTEGILERRVLEELIHDDVGIFAFLDGDGDPYRLLAVAEIVDVGHAGDPAAVDKVRQLLEQWLLGELVGDFGKDDLAAAILELFDLVLGPDDDPAPAGSISLLDAHPPANRRACGKIRTRKELHDRIEIDQRVVDIGDQSVADLAQIMRRDRGRHPHGDATRAIDQQVGKLAGQDPRFLVLLIVVGLEVDGVELDILEHLGGNRAELGLGIPHCRRRQTMDTAEIALAGDQQMPHVPPLGHACQGRIDRVITVRVISLHRLADDARTLTGRATGA